MKKQSEKVLFIKLKDIGINDLDLLYENLDKYSYSRLIKNRYYKKAYKAWMNMMQRCREGSAFRKKWKTYERCTVCEEWKDKNKFIRWYLEHYYEIKGEYVDVDKDILVKGNKEYAPDKCLLVPHRINVSIATGTKTHDNGLPLGVFRLGKRRYGTAEYFNYIKGILYRRKYVVLRFDTIQEEREQYLFHRQCQLRAMAEYYKDRIPNKVYQAIRSYKVD